MDNSVEKPKWLNVLFISSKGTTTCCAPYVFDEERWALFFFSCLFSNWCPIMRRTSSPGALRLVLCLTKSVLFGQEFQFPTEKCDSAPLFLCQSLSQDPGHDFPNSSHGQQHQEQVDPDSYRDQMENPIYGNISANRRGEHRPASRSVTLEEKQEASNTRHLVPYFLNSWAVMSNKELKCVKCTWKEDKLKVYLAVWTNFSVISNNIHAGLKNLLNTFQLSLVSRGFFYQSQQRLNANVHQTQLNCSCISSCIPQRQLKMILCLKTNNEL